MRSQEKKTPLSAPGGATHNSNESRRSAVLRNKKRATGQEPDTPLRGENASGETLPPGVDVSTQTRDIRRRRAISVGLKAHGQNSSLLPSIIHKHKLSPCQEKNLRE
jgi:hypothetical protein